MNRCACWCRSMVLCVAAVSAWAGGAALASGGGGGGGGGGGYGSRSGTGGNPGETRSNLFDGGTSEYNQGKSVFERKFACSDCPMADQRLNENTARDLLNNRLGVILSSEDSRVLDIYLKRRFRL